MVLPPSAVGNLTAHIIQGGREIPITIPDDGVFTISSYCGQVSLLVDAEHIMGNSCSSNFTLMFQYNLVDIDTEGMCNICGVFISEENVA